MSKTLKEVRLAQPERKSVAKVFRELLKRFPDPDLIPDERTLARLELRPIEEVDRILVAYWLEILDTTLDAEAPEVAERGRSEVEVLLRSLRYAAWDSNPEPTDFGPLPPLRVKARRRTDRSQGLLVTAR